MQLKSVLQIEEFHTYVTSVIKYFNFNVLPCCVMFVMSTCECLCLQYVFYSLLPLQKHRVWVKARNHNNLQTSKIIQCPDHPLPRFFNSWIRQYWYSKLSLEKWSNSITGLMRLSLFNVYACKVGETLKLNKSWMKRNLALGQLTIIDTIHS